MSKHDRSIPNLENATPEYLVDEIGRIRIEAARLKYLEGIFRQALEARCTKEHLDGGSLITGDRFIGHFENVTQERLDTQSVRDYFQNNPEILKELMKIVSFRQLKTPARSVEGS